LDAAVCYALEYNPAHQAMCIQVHIAFFNDLA
jgi:hypothetical protein